MKLKKSIKIILVVFALAIAGAFASSQTASAKTKWTRYVPTTLRGNWKSKKAKLPYDYLDYQPGTNSIKLTKDSSSDLINSIGGNFFDQKKMYYHHKKGSTYYYVRGNVKGLSAKDTMKMYTEFHKVGNKLHARIYGTYADNKLDKLKNPWSLWMYKK